MFLKKTSVLLISALTFILIFSVVGCEKLNISALKSSYHFNRGNQLFTDKQYRKAISEYEAALQFNPKLVQAYRFLGESYKQLYKPGVNTPLNKDIEKKALDALTKAHSIDPNNKEIIYSLGDMYDKLGKFNEAEKLYLRIIELEPGNMSNYYVVAEFYKRYAGDRPGIAKKAEAMYLRRIEADPENAQGYAYIANYYENLPATAENIDQAIVHFNRAKDFHDMRIRLQPNNPEAWLAKGVNRWSMAFRFQSLTKAQKLAVAQEALKSVEKARDLDPNYPEPYIWLSVVYKSLLSKLEPEKEARYNAEADKNLDRYQELRKKAFERKKLEEELKKNQ